MCKYTPYFEKTRVLDGNVIDIQKGEDARSVPGMTLLSLYYCYITYSPPVRLFMPAMLGFVGGA